MSDNVNHPEHYAGEKECIDVMLETQGEEAVKGFCVCNAIKYLYRHRQKGGVEDVKKAVWYLNKYIELCESKESMGGADDKSGEKPGEASDNKANEPSDKELSLEEIISAELDLKTLRDNIKELKEKLKAEKAKSIKCDIDIEIERKKWEKLKEDIGKSTFTFRPVYGCTCPCFNDWGTFV